jgi:drug/metabolite transporter (DMT)-like permease
VLAAVFLYACGSVVAKRAPRTHPVAFGAAAMTIAAALLAPVALGVEGWPATPGPAALGATLWLGLLSTALGQVLILRILAHVGPPFLSLVNFMVPAWTLAFAWLLLGERPEPGAGLALALILGGVALARGPGPAARGRLR